MCTLINRCAGIAEYRVDRYCARHARLAGAGACHDRGHRSFIGIGMYRQIPARRDFGISADLGGGLVGQYICCHRSAYPDFLAAGHAAGDQDGGGIACRLYCHIPLRFDFGIFRDFSFRFGQPDNCSQDTSDSGIVCAGARAHRDNGDVLSGFGIDFDSGIGFVRFHHRTTPD